MFFIFLFIFKNDFYNMNSRAGEARNLNTIFLRFLSSDKNDLMIVGGEKILLKLHLENNKKRNLFKNDNLNFAGPENFHLLFFFLSFSFALITQKKSSNFFFLIEIIVCPRKSLERSKNNEFTRNIFFFYDRQKKIMFKMCFCWVRVWGGLLMAGLKIFLKKIPSTRKSNSFHHTTDDNGEFLLFYQFFSSEVIILGFHVFFSAWADKSSPSCFFKCCV